MNEQFSSMVKPSKLCSGDTIGIVAPASSFDKENFKKGVKVLRTLGYKVKYERRIFNECWSKPGHNKQRALQINRMFANMDVHAILCAKGGSGSQDIIAHLDPTIIKANPKIFVGYSDITILLLYIQYIARMVVFHGPVVSGEIFEGMHPDTIDSLVRLLGKDETFGRIKFGGMKAINSGKSSGLLVGGNLTLILQSFDTEYEIETEDKILFLEEVNESVSVIVDGLRRLKNKEKLTQVRGVIFGRMAQCFKDEDEFIGCLKDIFQDVDYPVLYNMPSGHTDDIAQSHISLPFGIMVSVDTDKPSVDITESAVT